MHTTWLFFRDISIDRWCLLLLAIVLSIGCQDKYEGDSGKTDPAIEALNAVSAWPDTAAARRRLDELSDSLSRSTPTLSVRIAVTHARAELLRRRGMPDSGFSVLLQGMDMALRAGDSLALAGVLLDMCQWKEREGRFTTARSFSERSLALYRRHGSEKDVAAALDAVSRQLLRTGDYPGAQAMILEALHAYERTGDSRRSAEAYHVIGNINADIGDVRKAMNSYRRSVDIFSKTGDTGRLATVYTNIGLLYRRSNPDSALYYYDMALRKTRDPAYRLQQVIAQFNRANIFFDRKQYDEARGIYDTVMRLCRQYQFIDGIPRVLSGYAAVSGAKNDHQASRAYLTQARRMADSMGQSPLALWLRKEELNAAEKHRDIDSVIFISKDIKRREDSISGTEKKALVAELELRYQVAGKEREIGSLRGKLANRQWLIALLAALIVALSALTMLYRRQRRVLTQRNRSYELMIARYQSERDRLLQPPMVVASDAQRTDAQEVHPSPDIAIPEADNEAALLAAETLADYQRILALLQEDKLYTRSRLKAEDLADRVGMSARKLTAVLRAQGEDGFNALLNRFRIAEATRLMEDPESHILKLDTLAERCGFNSRQHFYRVFEQVTGVNPGYYRKRFGTGGKRDDEMSQD